MAKKSKGKHPKAGKIPKSVAGVKLPKSVRKPAEAIIAKASTPEGRRMIAAGLSMAAGALAARTQGPERADRPAPPRAPEASAAPLSPDTPDAPVPPVPPRAPTPPADTTPIVDPAAMVEAAGKAASAFIDGFLNRRR